MNLNGNRKNDPPIPTKHSVKSLIGERNDWAIHTLSFHAQWVPKDSDNSNSPEREQRPMMDAVI
jgi:hypothetical protein